jgi:hypothetical protein
VIIILIIIFPFQGRDEGERHGVFDPRAAGDGPLLRRHRVQPAGQNLLYLLLNAYREIG